MRKLTDQQAQKVVKKYLPIIKNIFKDDLKADVGVYSPSELGEMCYVYVSLSNEENKTILLDTICEKYNIDYDISDCL